jgi:GWxTD domain-containing protein
MFKKALFFLIVPTVIFSQVKFDVDFNYALFYVDKEFSAIEFYYSFAKNTLTPSENNGVKSVSGALSLIILDSLTTSKLVDENWDFNEELDQSETSQNEKLTGLLKYYLSPGKYTCILKGRDINNPALYDSVLFNIKVPAYDSSKILVSDIQLANKIIQDAADQNSPFYKNTLDVIPNPGSLFGHGVPVFYFYYEIYNADVNIKSPYLRVSYELLNSSGNSVYKKLKYMPRTNRSLVDIGAVKVNDYNTGQYNFLVTVEDTVSREAASSTRKLFIYNPDKLDTNKVFLSDVSFLSSSFLTMSEEELEKEFDEARYISNQNEKVDWKRLTTVESKREYLFNFWNMRDENKITPINETQLEYAERINYTRKKFSDLSQKEGWKTDRGRVFVIYGSPSEIERNPFTSETVPYEIWYYNEIEGGVIFVFADYSGFSSYKLVHSSKRGELKDESWSDRVRR